jgi:hypothetical protein
MELLPFRVVPPSARPVLASIRCVECNWCAMQTGANAIEASADLRARYRRHLAERHPDLTLEETSS